jgi:undecaprenyl-diphosphatase
MTVTQALLLGLLQGVTEFLPVSSSGHLALAKAAFSLGDVPLLFDVSLHLATLAAVLLYFRGIIARLLSALVRRVRRKTRKGDDACLRTLAALLAGTAVTAAFGAALHKSVSDLPLKVVSAGFIVTALMLVVSGRVAAKRIGGAPRWVSVRQGVIVGFAQGIGVLPGISRSGSTISGALLCGVGREESGEFSFLLSVPAVLGAFALELSGAEGMAQSVGAGALVLGCAAAFAAGLASLACLMKLIRRGRLEWFAVYLVPLGVAGLLFLH